MEQGPLTADDRRRYGRQMILDGWGEEGQLKLKRATVFIAGAGGLGGPVSIYLAVAGVGQLRICDADLVALSNLNRQILHDDSKIGVGKTRSARETLRRVNPRVTVEELAVQLDEHNVAELVADSQIIVDCLDNFPTRYVLNRFAAERGIPLVYGGVWGLDGSLSFFHVPETPCLRCVFPEEPPQDETFPVVGVTPGVIGCLQAMEVLKWLVGIGQNLNGRLLFLSGEEMAFYSFEQARDPDCPVCSRFHTAD
jgi:molybdopterin/thiamine biosynthesis adenylyltransferase